MYEMPKRGPDMVFTTELSGTPPQGLWESWAIATVDAAIKATIIVCFIMIFWIDDGCNMVENN